MKLASMYSTVEYRLRGQVAPICLKLWSWEMDEAYHHIRFVSAVNNSVWVAHADRCNCPRASSNLHWRSDDMPILICGQSCGHIRASKNWFSHVHSDSPIRLQLGHNEACTLQQNSVKFVPDSDTTCLRTQICRYKVSQKLCGSDRWLFFNVHQAAHQRAYEPCTLRSPHRPHPQQTSLSNEYHFHTFLARSRRC
jgi:hypothetical protein